jgi:hypothetical protein
MSDDNWDHEPDFPYFAAVAIVVLMVIGLGMLLS